MKKKLSLFALFLIALSCTKPVKDEVQPSVDKNSNKSISLSQAISMVNSSSMLTLTSTPIVKTTNLTFGSSGEVQSTDTSPNVIFRTHGLARWSTNGTADGPVKTLILPTENYNSYLMGSGIAVKYPFKHGKSYVIEISVSVEGWEIAGESIDVKNRKPKLQLQLTNSPTAGVSSYAPVNLIEPGPVTTITTSSSSHSINFLPTECFEYLRFSALPNTTGISRGSITFNSIKIIETSNIEVVGADYLDVNDQGTYNVFYAGLPINEQFNWRVSGDLQIIGSTTGASVVVKATGLSGGTIYGDLNGCQAVVSKVFAALDNQYISITGPGQVSVNTTIPSRFDIELSGPLAGKTITNTVWTIPSIYGNEYWGDTFIELMPTGSTGGNNLVANFLLDGTPAAVKRFVKVAP